MGRVQHDAYAIAIYRMSKKVFACIQYTSRWQTNLASKVYCFMLWLDICRHSLLSGISHQMKVMVTVSAFVPQFSSFLCVQSPSQLLTTENAMYEAGSLFQQHFVTTGIGVPMHIRPPFAHCV